MKIYFQNVLAFLAKGIVKKYRPDIVAITGSVGKTTAKEATVRVLSETFSVRGNEKSYNNELGVPLTIIGCRAPGRSMFGWCRVLFRALSLLVWKSRSYPAVLVLEMGADAPGDIEKLVAIAPPKIGLITAIGPTHLEKLGSVERLVEEKMKIFSRHTRPDQWIVLNADDPRLSSSSVGPQTLSFGTDESATLRISDITERNVFHSDHKDYISGVFCTLTFNDESVRVELPHLVGKHVLPSVIAAGAIGLIYRISLPEIAQRLHHVQPAVGRMHPIPGIKHTLLIDDTYNSSPNAARGALDVLMSFEIDAGARRIAVLGDMRELGAHTEEEHRMIGEYAGIAGVDYLLAVGEASHFLAGGARKYLDESRVFVFNDSASAGLVLQDMMEKGDIVLIKGSQNVLRMERIVKEVMAEPFRAEELLVRQDPEWQ
ncbi:MAG: UDP-N-acetylmuramoyl-tripeptide--D-alanyl-D-alanine ligase [Patescibacteria group bacterium]